MLYVKGQCLNCNPRNVDYKQNGISKSFTAHRCCLHDPSGNTDPIYVETGEIPLEKGKAYRIPVYVRPFFSRAGEARFQLMAYKDQPPVEIKLAEGK
jgi:hypothetical protein